LFVSESEDSLLLLLSVEECLLDLLFLDLEVLDFFLTGLLLLELLDVLEPPELLSQLWLRFLDFLFSYKEHT